jgi:hypothetical protein
MDDQSRAEPADPHEGGYRPKPPLWTGETESTRSYWTVVGSILLSALIVGLLAIFMEGWFFVAPEGQVEVVVVRVQLAIGAREEAPSTFLHVVRLPDGSQRTLSCAHMYSPGERLLVTESRGFFTGRRHLGAPYRVVAPAPEPPPGASPFE